VNESASIGTTAEEPVLVISRAYGHPMRFKCISVRDIDPEFPKYSLIESVVNELIRGRQYDDSDGNNFLCYFVSDRPDDVKRQWAALLKEHPEYGAGDDEE